MDKAATGQPHWFDGLIRNLPNNRKEKSVIA